LRVAFDTSIFVASLVSAHPHHARAVVWLRAVSSKAIQGVASVHALGETYSVLTKLPVAPQLAPEDALRMIDAVATAFEVIPLSRGIYDSALQRCAMKGARSGAIYDALHLATAEAANVDKVLTFNAPDFQRLVIAGGPLVTVPPEPPAVVLAVGNRNIPANVFSASTAASRANGPAASSERRHSGRWPSEAALHAR
jgi:predicted nucleic acid-binding protein